MFYLTFDTTMLFVQELLKLNTGSDKTRNCNKNNIQAASTFYIQLFKLFIWPIVFLNGLVTGNFILWLKRASAVRSIAISMDKPMSNVLIHKTFSPVWTSTVTASYNLWICSMFTFSVWTRPLQRLPHSILYRAISVYHKSQNSVRCDILSSL
jgi:hypothetical protein